MSESNISSNPDPTTDTAPDTTQQEVLGGPQGDTTRKDPEEWVTEASEHIDRLQSASDRTS